MSNCVSSFQFSDSLQFHDSFEVFKFKLYGCLEFLDFSLIANFWIFGISLKLLQVVVAKFE